MPRTHGPMDLMPALVAVLGVAVGVVSGTLGAGPSILSVLLLTRVAGLELHCATATALVVVAVMSVVALAQYAAEGAIVWKPAASFGLASVTAAFLAGHFAQHVPDRVLLGIFLVSMAVAAVAMLVVRPTRDRGNQNAVVRADALCTVVLAGSGLLVGTLTGLIGLGGGFAVVPLLVVFARTPVRSAMGASFLVIAVNTVAGLAGHFPHPPVDWGVAAYLSVAEGAGAVVGARLSRRMSHVTLRRGFAGLLLLAAAVLLGRSL